MKATFRNILCSVLFLAPGVLSGAWDTPQVYESESELFGSADLTGDGLPDILLIDRDDGVFLIGETGSGGGVVWRAPRASGIKPAEHAAFGDFGAGGEPGFAVGGRRANRIQVFAGSAPPLAAFPPEIGPGPFAGIPAATLGENEDGLLASTVENEAGELSIRSVLGRAEEGFSVLSAWKEGAQPGFTGYAFFDPEADHPLFVSRMDFPEGSQVEAVLVFEELDSGSVSSVAEIQAVSDARPVFGNFLGNDRGQFVLFVPGEPGVALYEVVEDNGSLNAGVHDHLNTDVPVERLIRLPGSQIEPARLLVLLDGGATSRVYEYDTEEGFVEIDALAPQADGEFLTGGVALGEGGFMLFSGPEAGGKSTGFHRIGPDGEGGYEVAESGSLPRRYGGFLGANVALYEGNPMADVDSRLLERRGADAWTSRGGFDGSPEHVIVVGSYFGGVTRGLTGAQERDLGRAPDDASHVLTNQPDSAAPFSVYDFEPVAGPAVDPPGVSPVPGTYDRSIPVALEAAPGTHAYYRTGDGGDWTAYGGPFWIFEDTEIQYFSRAPGGATSGIRSAQYVFSVDPHEMDSNGNGVPDFVEIHEGDDPRSGNVRDGSTSLDRLLGLDTDGGEHADVRASFDIVADVRAFFDDGVTARGDTGTGVGVFDAVGARLASARMDEAAAEFPRVRIPDIPIDLAGSVYVGRTQSFFPLDQYDEDDALGREVISVRSAPLLAAPEIEYEFGQAGGDLADEVDAWIAAASDAFRHTGRRAFNARVAPVDTLHAAIVERAFASLLADSGEWAGGALDDATLFPFRSGDSGRRAITGPDLRSLADFDPERGGGVFRPAGIVDDIRTALDMGDGAVADLRAFANTVHRIGAQEGGDASAGDYPEPLEVFRALVKGEALPGDYRDDGGWSDTELAELTGTANDLVDLPEPRTPVHREFFVDHASFLGTCLTVFTADGDPVSLVHADGRPYRFPGAFPLPAGTEIQVLGFEDPVRSECAVDPFEVVSVWILKAPRVVPEDEGGNLLSDDWERFFFGEAGAADPFDSPDGSGYSALQQYLEGTDPTDSADLPSEPAEDLSPPRVRIEMTPDGTVELDWDWSERYAESVQFYAEHADSPQGPYETHPVSATHEGNGRFTVDLPEAVDAAQFYRVFMTLGTPE